MFKHRSKALVLNLTLAFFLMAALGLGGCDGIVEEKSSGTFVTSPPDPNNNSNDDPDEDPIIVDATDSDNDGVSDDDEINLYQTDPLNPNTDNDDQLDGFEVQHLSTRNPLNPDDDGDGVPGAPGSTGQYASGLTVDCNNDDATIFPGAPDAIGSPDKNCGPDVVHDSLVFHVDGSSTVTYTVDVTTNGNATGLFVRAQEGFPGGYECEFDNLGQTALATDFSCSTWSNPPWYMHGVPIGFHVAKMGPKTWLVEARAKTCFNCTSVVSEYQSKVFGE